MFSLFIEINVEADGLTVSNLRIAQELNATESYEVKVVLFRKINFFDYELGSDERWS